ncbi:MAG: LytR C-terminal domain-containing protein [Eubacterium sp.]|nr:LytR C-terminal domain-containing protein [Eubacterium sp.]MBR1673691.1 LytR C-terminal domain-containing protein [Eubacterium sp.]
MQKKRSAVGLFFSYFFRGIVVILAIVILVLSVFLIKGVIRGKQLRAKNSNKAAVDESILTEHGDPDDLLTNSGKTTEDTEDSGTQDGLGDDSTLVSSENLKIVVLNATEVYGLAGSWTSRLQDAGYTDVTAANSFVNYDHTSIVVAEEGMGTDLLKYFPDAELRVGSVGQDETDADVSGVQIFIVVGASDAGEQ